LRREKRKTVNLPKSVAIAGRTWPVIMDKSVDGGKWKSDPGEIRIGPHKSDEERVIWFLHEVLEAILTLRNHRYESYPDENYLFVFDHREFINIVRDFYLAVPILPMKGKK
jgi:hypothetical protein